MAEIAPYSDPFTFVLQDSAPIPPFSNPFTFILTDSPGLPPFSDPVTVNIRDDIWFVAVDGGWASAEFVVAIS